MLPQCYEFGNATDLTFSQFERAVLPPAGVVNVV